MTEMATPVARRNSADAGGASLGTPPTLAVPSYSVSDLELQVSRLSVEHRHLSAMVQAMTARQSAVQTQLDESTAALRDALRANSDAAAAASQRRAWSTGSSPDEVSVVLGKHLRPLQRDAIFGVLDGFDTWLILPAGAGKTHPMHVLAAMTPGSLTLLIFTLLTDLHALDSGCEEASLGRRHAAASAPPPRWAGCRSWLGQPRRLRPRQGSLGTMATAGRKRHFDSKMAHPLPTRSSTLTARRIVL